MEELSSASPQIWKRRVQLLATHILSAFGCKASSTRLGEKRLPRQVDCQTSGARPRHRHHRYQQVESDPKNSTSYRTEICSTTTSYQRHKIRPQNLRFGEFYFQASKFFLFYACFILLLAPDIENCRKI